MTTRDIKFTFLGDSKSLQSSMGKVGGGLDKLSTKMAGFGTKAKRIGTSMTKMTLPLAAAFAFGAKSIIENEQLLAQTASVIASTGSAANVTADNVEDLAKSISGYSGIAHESIIEGENMLLTFKNIKNQAGENNDIFDQSTVLLADMSQAMGTDMQSAAIQLGKALNDPILGITALNRVGITFSDEQKELIKTLQKSGDTMGAQKIILAELESQFGGSAKAAGETMGGQLKIMKNNMEEATRGLVTALMPAIAGLAKGLSVVVDWFNNLSPGMKTVIGIVAGLAVAIGPLITIIGALSVALAFLAANPIVLIIAALVAIGVGLVVLFKKNEDFRNAVLGVWDTIKGIFEGAFAAIQGFFEAFSAVAGGIWSAFGDDILAFAKLVWGAIKIHVETVIGVIQGIIQTVTALIKGDWSAAWEGIKKIFSTVWDGIKGIVDIQIKAVKLIISTQLGILKGIWSGVWNGIKQVFVTIWNAIKALASLHIMAVSSVILTVVRIFKGIWQTSWNTIKTIFNNVWEAIKTIAINAWNFINNNVIQPIVRAVATVKRLISSIPTPGSILSSTTGFLSGLSPFQHGGPVAAGVPILVGEKGREVFVPDTAGLIVPNNQLGGNGRAAVGGVAGAFAPTVNIHTTSNDPQELARIMERELVKIARRNGFG